MLNNFQLAVIVKKAGQVRLLEIPLHQELQDSLAENWVEQYEAFMDEIQEIDFDAGYSPEIHECFRLVNYELPDWLVNESSLTVPNLDAISDHDDLVDSIRSIVAFTRDDNGRELILFQNFSRSHIIRPGRFLFLQNNTYESAARPGLTLDSKLSAVYVCAEQKLLFHNFRTTNTFLPLETFYEEASELEILEVLQHDLLAPEDADALAANANQWFRKRFAMLRDSQILENYTAHQIREHANDYAVNIELDGDRIVFPQNRPAAKRLLQFLNEEIFRGAITETLYETNSKREADQ